MCGRYALILSGKIKELPFVEESATQLELELPWECYNVAPTLKVPILDADRGLKLSVWGMIPHWAKEPPKRPLINARAETAAEKPSFRVAYKSHRCAVPSSGFFEWSGTSKARMPHFIPPSEGELVWFAGLASRWKHQNLELLSHCLLTHSSANTTVNALHDRCPVALSEKQVDAWLDGSVEWEDVVAPNPYGTPYRVTTSVNKADNDSPENLEPISE